MRILNWTEFAALPEGTIFSFTVPRICEGLHRKGQTICRDRDGLYGEKAGEPMDFFYASIVPDYFSDARVPTVEDAEGRWGVYEYDQQFAVLDTEDIAKVIGILTEGRCRNCLTLTAAKCHCANDE